MQFYRDGNVYVTIVEKREIKRIDFDTCQQPAETLSAESKAEAGKRGKWRRRSVCRNLRERQTVPYCKNPAFQESGRNAGMDHQPYGDGGIFCGKGIPGVRTDDGSGCQTYIEPHKCRSG